MRLVLRAFYCLSPSEKISKRFLIVKLTVTLQSGISRYFEIKSSYSKAKNKKNERFLLSDKKKKSFKLKKNIINHLRNCLKLISRLQLITETYEYWTLDPFYLKVIFHLFVFQPPASPWVHVDCCVCLTVHENPVIYFINTDAHLFRWITKCSNVS